MAESKRRPRSLKGAVLIMVITILFVLIVMLLATLAVVSSTTQRTYTKYEETQAYYTARSVLEVYIDEILTSKEDFNIDVANPSDSNQKIIMDAMMAGGFDNIKYLDGAGAEQEGLPVKEDSPGHFIKIDYAGKEVKQGFAYQQEIFGYLRPKFEWDPTGTAPGTAKPSDDRNWKRYKDNEDKCYLTYKVPMPEINGVAGVGKTESLDSDGEVEVKVELLRILYRNKAGQVITDNVKDVDITGGMGHLSTLSTDVDNCVDWTQTYYRLKVTSTANISTGAGDDELNNEVSVSVILEPKDVPSPSGFVNAMTSLSNSATANHIYTIGGASANCPGTAVEFGGATILHGSYVYKNNLNFQNSGIQWFMDNPNDSFVVHGGILYGGDKAMQLKGYGPWDTSSASELQKRPYIYAAGIKVDGFLGGKIGDFWGAVDLILTSDSADSNLVDKAYVWVPDCVPDKSKVLFTTGNNDAVVYGDVYCDGDMFIGCNNTKIYGNVYCTGTIYVGSSSSQYFQKNVYCGAVKDTSGNNVGTPANMLSDSGNSFEVGSSTVSGVSYKITDTSTESCEVTLPGPRGKVNISNMASVSSIYTYGANKVTPPSGKSDADIMTAEDMFKKTCGKDDVKLEVNSSAPSIFSSIESGSIQEKDEDGNVIATYSGQVLKASKGVAGAGDMIDFKLDFSANNYNGTYYIDATEKPVHIQLLACSSENSKPNFVVVGDEAVYITMKDGDKWSGAFGFYNTQIYNMQKNGDTFYFGDNPKTADTPAAPNIYYYIGTGCEFQTVAMSHQVDNVSHKFCGYMYGPYADLKNTAQVGNGNGNAAQIKYYYNQSPNLVNAKEVALFGSMVFGSIYSQNDYGVCYIANDGGGGSSGGAGTNIDWKKQRYLNS